jgi:hypothetical protein
MAPDERRRRTFDLIFSLFLIVCSKLFCSALFDSDASLLSLLPILLSSAWWIKARSLAIVD